MTSQLDQEKSHWESLILGLNKN